MSYGEIHGVTLVRNPTNADQMGALERNVGPPKETIDRVKSSGQSLTDHEEVRLACLVRNNSLIMGGGVAPSHVAFRKCDYLGGLDQGRIHPLEHPNSEESRMQKHVTTVSLARYELMRRDAERTTATCLQRNSRPGSKHPPEIGASADIGIDGRWCDGWRMVGVIASNVVVEQDGKFRKLPPHHVRTTGDQMLLRPAPLESGNSGDDVSKGVREGEEESSLPTTAPEVAMVINLAVDL